MAATSMAVTVSMGVMKPVLQKLATLMGDKYKNLKRLWNEVSFLVEELSDMKALLEKMDNAADELDSQAKKWRKDIIDMSYDIEDCIDNFMDRVGDADDKVGILKKASHYLRTIKDRYRIANKINEIKNRVIEASKHRDRYNLNVCTSSSTTKVAVDPRLTALYTDSTTLVGIDTQKEELVKWVEDEEKQLKVMSIVGFGGLGKTTLANEVYHDVEGHFNSKAFVPVSQKLDVPRLVSSVCSKLGLTQSSHACEVQELIDTLRAYLHDKRYFIILDDLWNVQDWDIIRRAFPPNNQQSRLIVTTRIKDVAQDYTIGRDELIDLWVAERIVVSKSPGQDVRDVAQSYFNELVNRNMIEPPKSGHGYRVHDMMLDLIIKRCREDNFVSVVHSAQVVVQRQDKVHRLSVSLSGGADDHTKLQVATNCCRSQVCSLVSLGASKWMPPLSKLKSLQVLFLEFDEISTRMDLTGVGQLSQLRYLKIDCKVWISYSSGSYIVLPSEIWRLRHLERMEVPFISVCNTPSDIVDLPCLSVLILPVGTTLPYGIGKMKSLRTLKFFTLEESSPENIKGLSELNKLEELCLDCRRDDDGGSPKRTYGDTSKAIWMDALVFSLEKLSNLKFFELLSYSLATGADALSMLSPPFHNLENFNLEGLIFSRVPRWIGGLQKLRWLKLGAKEMPQEDIGTIGTLPSLLELHLRIPGVPTERVVDRQVHWVQGSRVFYVRL